MFSSWQQQRRWRRRRRRGCTWSKVGIPGRWPTSPLLSSCQSLKKSTTQPKDKNKENDKDIQRANSKNNPWLENNNLKTVWQGTLDTILNSCSVLSKCHSWIIKNCMYTQSLYLWCNDPTSANSVLKCYLGHIWRNFAKNQHWPARGNLLHKI